MTALQVNRVFRSSVVAGTLVFTGHAASQAIGSGNSQLKNRFKSSTKQRNQAQTLDSLNLPRLADIGLLDTSSNSPRKKSSTTDTERLKLTLGTLVFLTYIGVLKGLREQISNNIKLSAAPEGLSNTRVIFNGGRYILWALYASASSVADPFLFITRFPAAVMSVALLSQMKLKDCSKAGLCKASLISTGVGAIGCGMMWKYATPEVTQVLGALAMINLCYTGLVEMRKQLLMYHQSGVKGISPQFETAQFVNFGLSTLYGISKGDPFLTFGFAAATIGQFAIVRYLHEKRVILPT